LRSPPTCQLSCYITFDEWLHHQLPALQHSTSAPSSARTQAPDRNKPISWVDYTQVAPCPGIPVWEFANFGRSTAAPSRIIDLHAKPRASLETKHPSQLGDDITTTRFLGFLDGSHTTTVNNSPIFFFVSIVHLVVTHVSQKLALLCFSLRVWFLHVWDLGAVSVVCYCKRHLSRGFLS
jgi:hypothetical protein